MMSMNQSSGSGPFSKLANMTVSSANNFIGADFGVEKTGIEKLKEAFNKSASKTTPVIKKKKVSGPSTTTTTGYVQMACSHNWISAGMRPIHSSMDSEAVLVCPDCGGSKCIRVPHTIAQYGGPGGGGSGGGNGYGGGGGGFYTTSGTSTSDPFAGSVGQSSASIMNSSSSGVMRNNSFIDPNNYL